MLSCKMAMPGDEDSGIIWMGKIHAIGTYRQVIISKPETKFDGKSNVLVSIHTLPNLLKDGVVEVDMGDEGSQGGENSLSISISTRCPDQRVLRVVMMSRTLSLTKNLRQRKLYVESFRSCLQELLHQDDRLSKTEVIVCDGDENVPTAISETAGDHCILAAQHSISQTENIGEGLACLYYFNQLYPVLQGMEDRVAKRSHQKLLQTVVVDCSNDLATVNDERLKGVAWITIGVAPCGKTQGLVRSQVFQLEDNTVIIECPEPIWTLKTLRKNEKLSQKKYETECLSFRRTLKKIIAAKVTSGQIREHQCSVYDGNGTNLVEHIRSCADKYNTHRVSVGELSDIEADCSDGGLETDSVAVSSPISCHINHLPYSGKDGKELDDGDSGVGCADRGGKDNTVMRLVLETRDEIVTWDVFCLAEEAEGDYVLKFGPSLDTSVDVVTSDDVGLNVDMIAAALKQENLISDEVKSRLTSASSHSPHRKAGLVLQLMLFILNLNVAIYPSLARAFEGLKQRAKQLKDGTPEGGNSNSHKGLSMEEAKLPKEKAASINSKTAETKSSKTSLKGPEAKLQIISNILFKMVEDKNYYPYDFEVQLRRFIFENKQDVCKLRNKDGLTLLQQIVASSRSQFFSPLFRAGCWTDLKPLKADKGPYEGKTAEEICSNARFRKVQKEMDTYTTWEKSLNQIHLAARKGDLAEAKRMLKFSQDLHNEPDSMECTSLYWAVVGGNIDIVKLLMSLKVDHMKVNKRKESLLHIACIIGHTHLLTTLVKDLRMDWTVKDAAKKSALLRIAENGDDKSLAKLTKCGLRKDQLGPILAIAGHYGRLGFLKKAIEDQGVDPGSKDEAGKSAFMRACEQGKLDVARYLLTRSIGVGETDTRRRNVFHMAADGAGVEMMEFLINEFKTRKGDDVLRGMLNQRDKYIGGELCMLIRGKDKGRDSWHYVEVSRGLMDVFMKRTRSGTIDVAKYGTLLHSGWGVDPDDESAREIEQRFETRRNANQAEDLDVTPLHIAVFKDKEDVAELLMEKGCDVNVRDKFGLTPLHVAAMRGNLAIVKGLLKRGAATDMLDNLIKTPMDVAEDNEHREVASFIRSNQYLPVAQNFRERILPNIQRLIGEEYIRELQESGRDVRTHLINTLRDLTIDINESLLAIGSGPVLEESTPNDPVTKD